MCPSDGVGNPPRPVPGLEKENTGLRVSIHIVLEELFSWFAYTASRESEPFVMKCTLQVEKILYLAESSYPLHEVFGPWRADLIFVEKARQNIYLAAKLIRS